MNDLINTELVKVTGFRLPEVFIVSYLILLSLLLSIAISIFTKSFEHSIFNIPIINSSEGSNNFIHLWWQLIWINVVRQLEFSIIVSSRWRKRMVLSYKKQLKIHQIEIVILILVLTGRYPISLSFAQNIRFLRRLIFHGLHIWSAYFCIFIMCGSIP